MHRFMTSPASVAAAAALACFASSAFAVGNSDLLLHYDFEHLVTGTGGVTMPDVSGHGNEGHFIDLGNGGAPSSQAKFGAGAFQLAAVQTPDNFTLPTDAFSIALWMKFPQSNTIPNDIQMLACNCNGGFTTDGFRLYLNDYQTNDGRIVLETADGTNGAGMAFKAVTPNDGLYHLLVFTFTQTDPQVGGGPDAFTWYDNTYIANGGPFNGAMNPNFKRTGPIRFGGLLDGAFAPGGVQ